MQSIEWLIAGHKS